jgi:GxxExxY protein
MSKFSQLSQEVIGAAIEVHKNLGPGLLESAYQKCLAYEFSARGINFNSEYPIPIKYKNTSLDCGYRIDFMIENSIIVELKSVEKIMPIHQAQILSYMKLTNIKHGFLMNFNVELLKQGIKSLVL